VSLGGRLARLEKAAADRDRARAATDRFEVVILVPVERAGGRPLGLHRSGPPGSRVGAMVYDPAHGDPDLPAATLSPWALVIGGEAMDAL
jgi:hypothetical protein